MMNPNNTSDKDINDVKNAAANYVEALRTGNIDRLADIYNKDCVTYGTVDGKLVGGIGSNPTVDFIKTHGAAPEIVAVIDILDITPSTAIVRVATEKDAVGSTCNDYLTFIKIEGNWSVIAKVFHQFD